MSLPCFKSLSGLLAIAFFTFLGLLLPGAAALANVPPVIDSFTGTLSTVPPGGTVTFTLNAHDPDCAGTCTSGCGQYIRNDLTIWTATGGTFTAQNNGSAASPYTATADWQAPSIEGQYTVSISISDSGSFLCGGRMSASSDLLITVSSAPPNQAPVVDSLAADSAQLYIGTSTGLQATAHDPDTDPVSYGWAADFGTVTPAGEGAATFQAPGSPGLAQVTVTVTDGKGGTASKTITISVTDANPEKSITGPIVTPTRVASDSFGNLFVADRNAGGVLVLNESSGEQTGLLRYLDIVSVDVDWVDRILLGRSGGASLLGHEGEFITAFNPSESMGSVTDAAVDDANSRYVVLYGNSGRVVVFAQDGTPLLSFGSVGDAQGQFRGPLAVAVNAAGEIIVGDSGHQKIQIFDASGSFSRSFGSAGSGAGQFNQIHGVTTDTSGRIYVSDGYHSRVQVFNSDGTLREIIGSYGAGLGQFMIPTGVHVMASFGKLVVASTNASNLQVFNLEGATEPPSNTAPAAPVPTNPLGGSVLPMGVPVMLQVLNSDDPDYQQLQYEFELYDQAGPTLIHAWTVTGGQVTTEVDASAFTASTGGYLWRARAYDGYLYSPWCAEQAFQVSSTINAPPGAPIPQDPAGDALVSDTSPFLIAANAADANGDQLVYDFEVALVIDGAYQAVADSGSVPEGAGVTVWQVPASILGLSQRAYWRCRAYDGFVYGAWSAYEPFRTGPLMVPSSLEVGNIPCGDMTRPMEVRYQLPPSSADLTVYFQLYDITSDAEVSFEVNSLYTHTIEGQYIDSWSFTLAMKIPASELNEGSPNIIRFVHPSAADSWGVRRVSLTAPLVPSLAATAYNTVIDLSWPAVSGLSQGTIIRIFRAFDPGGPFIVQGDYDPALRLARDTGLTNGVTYYYRAAYATPAESEGESSPVISATPSTSRGITPITDLKVRKEGDDLVLEWTPVTCIPSISDNEVYRDTFSPWVADTGTFSNLFDQAGPLAGKLTVPNGVLTAVDQWYSVIPLDYDGFRATP